MKRYITRLSLLTIFLLAFSSCELERLESAQETAPGGGTLTEFKAYTIESTDPMGSNVNGRIVFWKTNLEQTLVQISLYNTIPGELHPALIFEGAVGTDVTTMMTLDSVDGDSGELSQSKFFIIPDTDFYDSIEEDVDAGINGLDAHINIYLNPTDDTIVATGNIGSNADPVASN